MPNDFESFSTNTRVGERSGEAPRTTLKDRGEKTLKSEHETHQRELLEKYARLKEEIAELEKSINEKKAYLGIGQGQIEDLPIAEPAASGKIAETSEENPEPEIPEPKTQEEPTFPSVSEDAEGPTPETQTTTTESPTENPEKLTPAEIAANIKKTKQKPNAKRFIRNMVIVALAGLGIFALGHMSHNTDNQPIQSSTEVVQQMQDYGETMESERGIYDGYGEKGMWLSESKPGKFQFAYAPEVAEACEADEVEMIKYTARNQVESFADYMANLPEQLQPEGFKGLNILETEAKLESLSDEEFDTITDQFNDIMNNAYTRKTNLNGTYQNSYMRQIDPSNAVIHSNMELVGCTTNENNIPAEEFFWLDENGNEIGSMTVKIIYDDKGNIIDGCLQVANPIGAKNIYAGMPTVEDIPNVAVATPDDPSTPETTVVIPDQSSNPENPDKHSENIPETPKEEVAPKDAENLERIDNNIFENIATDINTEKVEVTPTEAVSPENITERPTPEAYQGTEPDIVQNEASREAESVQEQVSPANDYSQDRGGANVANANPNPVIPNEQAQQSADAGEIPISEAPGEGSDISDILGDLGIN